jgi:hypothetical protein
MATRLEVHDPSNIVPISSRRRPESPYAQRIREGGLSSRNRVMFNVRWVEALMLLEHDDELDGLSIDEFHEAVGRAITAMDALPEAELEQIAERFSL